MLFCLYGIQCRCYCSEEKKQNNNHLKGAQAAEGGKRSHSLIKSCLLHIRKREGVQKVTSNGTFMGFGKPFESTGLFSVKLEEHLPWFCESIGGHFRVK